MSDALSYLVKVRPEAMGHYLAFLKSSGRRLDPKTRALISVITKVHAQTERGFRQYLGRALREGCSAGEVLDALLMAFPALGLTKIIWAVDIILAMELPEFEAGALQASAAEDAATWHDVVAAAALSPGEVKRLQCDGRGLFVYRAGAQGATENEGAAPDEWRVYDSLCPHQRTDIPHLALGADGVLTCPKHGWAFDIASGACIREGTSPLKRWPSKVEGGRVLARF